MKFLFTTTSALILLTACVPNYQSDLQDNQYFEKTIYSDRNAFYVGEWTASTGPALTSIKIMEDGNIKICSSNEYFGSSNGKVFMESGKTKMIFESGTQFEILSSENDYLNVSSYNQEYKYYSGKVPERCKQIFSKIQQKT